MNASGANLALIHVVASRLGELRSRVVFLGGATIALLITDPASAYIRATDDVDIIIEVGSYGEYMNELRNELRDAGFREDHSENAPRCRWIIDQIKVDIMPTDQSVLGFTNKWYPDALREAVSVSLANDLQIRLITAPLLVATKIEAFHGRGEGDYQASRDIEDIIRVIDGRPSIINEVRNASQHLQTYLHEKLGDLLCDADFIDAIPCHLLGDDESQSRAIVIEKRLRQITTAG